MLDHLLTNIILGCFGSNSRQKGIHQTDTEEGSRYHRNAQKDHGRQQFYSLNEVSHVVCI